MKNQTLLDVSEELAQMEKEGLQDIIKDIKPSARLSWLANLMEMSIDLNNQLNREATKRPLEDNEA